MSGLTLVEARKAMAIGPEQSLVEIFDSEHPIWAVLPFVPANEGGYSFTREQTLPGTAVRGLNEGYTASQGVLNPLRENMATAGGDIDVDVRLIRDYGEGIVATHQAMKQKSLSHLVGDMFVNGNSLSAPKQFDGLKARLPGLTTSGQVISNLPTSGSPTSGGDPLRATHLDTLFSSVRGPNQVLFMTRAMQNVITAGARNSSVLGYVEYTTDDIGRKIVRYNDTPIVIVDPVGGVYNTIASDEADQNGAGSTAQSIFLASLSTTGMHGIWNGPPTVTMNVPMQDPYRRTRVELDVGMAIKDPYAVARLRNILVTGAMVA